MLPLMPKPEENILMGAESPDSLSMAWSFVGVMRILNAEVHFGVWQTA